MMRDLNIKLILDFVEEEYIGYQGLPNKKMELFIVNMKELITTLSKICMWTL